VQSKLTNILRCTASLESSCAKQMTSSHKVTNHAPQVMYYTPAILQLAGVTDKRTALLVALVPAAVNAAGTLVGMAAIDRCGRRCEGVALRAAVQLLGWLIVTSS
jgi:Sugar (and other) transporter